jgi:hypothetical protein
MKLVKFEHPAPLRIDPEYSVIGAVFGHREHPIGIGL